MTCRDGRDAADVIVVGAGPAGCTAAIRLAEVGHDVLLLERKAVEEGEDIASGELLAPMAQEELAQVGVELPSTCLFDRFTAVRNVYPDMSWTTHRLPPGIAWTHVDKGGLGRALRSRATAAGARLVRGARVTGLAFQPTEAVVETAEGATWRAQLVLDAGGRYAPSLRLLDLKREDPEFRQIGVALFFSSFAGAVPDTWNRHLYGERGAMISGGRIRPGLYRYICEADLADKQAEGLRPVEFIERMAHRHDPWLSERFACEARVGEPWAMAPIGYRVLEVARPRLLLCGDAAGYLSPLTGQGLEFAMRMGRLAARTAHDALAVADCSGDALAGYARERADELETALGYLRHMLRNLRDRAALLRASRDDEERQRIFGPFFGRPDDRGRLITEAAG
jgi:flavin-dependent dehydrogenase